MIECVDVFSGAGGLSLGLRQAGLRIRAAIEGNPNCVKTYQANFPGVYVFHERVQDVSAERILAHVRDHKEMVLAGGPPCQLFSRLNRWGSGVSDEFVSYTKLLEKLRPGVVVLENVPQIRNRTEAWSALMKVLKRLKYNVQYRILRASDFGVPQHRERLLLVASQREISLPFGHVSRYTTVREAIGHLPEADATIPNHVGMNLNPDNLRRIRSIIAGGLTKGWSDTFRDSYSRMEWDRPAPTITTKCISFSNGRFGHPEFDRALTIREAAILQGFPDDFVFSGSLWECARQVGNAVPPPVACAVGKAIVSAYRAQRRSLQRRAG